MTSPNIPEEKIGRPYALNYQRPTTPTPDSSNARLRLYRALVWLCEGEIPTDLKYEYEFGSGFSMPPEINSEVDYERFFLKAGINDLITFLTYPYSYFIGIRKKPFALKWRDKVREIFDDHNLGYYVDDECGIHPSIDHEFSQNVQSTIAALNHPDYAGVQIQFKKALVSLERKPTDCREAVSSAFFALETLSKRINKINAALGPEYVDKVYLPLIIEIRTDEHEKDAYRLAIAGAKSLINAGQMYRHGQDKIEDHQPSLDFAVFYVSQVASLLRLLATAHRKRTRR